MRVRPATSWVYVRGGVVGQAHEARPVQVHQVDVRVAVDRPFEGDLSAQRDRGEAGVGVRRRAEAVRPLATGRGHGRPTIRSRQ